jgi:hypothetical protein
LGESYLQDNVSGVRDITELKERTIKRTWDEFLPRHPDLANLQLGFRAFGSAIWEEAWPSIQDYAIEALVYHATSSGKVSPCDKRIIPAEGVGESEICQEALSEQSRTQRRRGRRPNTSRQTSIRSAINKYGDDWRNHLPEICNELEADDVFLGNLEGKKIDLDDGQSVTVSKWSDLDLAVGAQRQSILDVLRKYRDRLDQKPSSELDPIPSN